MRTERELDDAIAEARKRLILPRDVRNISAMNILSTPQSKRYSMNRPIGSGGE
jgi:hypothetical protein